MSFFKYNGLSGAVRGTDPSTSHEAAAATNATQLEELVFNSLLRDGPGASDTVAERLHIDKDSITPRFAPLRRRGRIRARVINGVVVKQKSLTSKSPRIVWEVVPERAV
jgi:hypothetical protein|tara:strand:+ start:1536 stop:1862 length:327 start_codon:yes stop_codon:yes gene_type:complete